MKNKTIEDNFEYIKSSSEEIDVLSADNYTDERFQFISYIEKELHKTQDSKQKKIINRIIADNDIKKFDRIKDLNIIKLNGDIDLILFLIYLKLKRS